MCRVFESGPSRTPFAASIGCRRMLAMLFALTVLSPAWARQDVTIGILSYAERPISDLQPTLKYLAAALPGYAFKTVLVDLEGMRRIVRGREVDFVITNPGNYVELELSDGISRIATVDAGEGARVGAVIW